MPRTIDNPFSLRAGHRRGIALLMVLLIVMAITVLALGFMNRADVELACGGNMLLRLQMDQLAASGLEHAKGLLLHPQDASTLYWQGAASQQLMAAASSDYYDVNVVRDASDYCTYDITCDAYRLNGTERMAQCRLLAQLRLDPCIGLWTGSDLDVRANWVIQGDLYAAGSVVNWGLPAHLNGDVFSAGAAPGAVGAHKAPADLLALLSWPTVTKTYFSPDYTTFSISSGSLSNQTFQPPHIWSYTGDLTIGQNVTIEGMLLVDGNLTFAGTGSKILGQKNLPALYTSRNLIFRGASNTEITGLVVVDGSVLIRADTTDLCVTGALCTKGRIAEMAVDSSGNGNDAVLHSQPGVTAGRLSGALVFDGVDDYLQTADSGQLQLADYTLSVWMKPAPTQKDWAALVCKTDASAANHWTLQFSNTMPKTLIVYHSTSTWDTGIALSALADGAWHHVAVVRSGANMTSYVDGLPCSSGTFADVPRTGNGHLNIGADRTASTSHVYAGSLDDIRIYDCPLGQTDIEQLSAGRVDVGTPIGHWTFDEAGSSVTIRADPAAASIVLLSAGVAEYWGPAVDGFFRRICRGATP
jgi:hypothetical protein